MDYESKAKVFLSPEFNLKGLYCKICEKESVYYDEVKLKCGMQDLIYEAFEKNIKVYCANLDCENYDFEKSKSTLGEILAYGSEEPIIIINKKNNQYEAKLFNHPNVKIENLKGFEKIKALEKKDENFLNYSLKRYFESNSFNIDNENKLFL
ncbi:MAG: hypothetical protein PHN56_01125 [Candidatus Nanoarchaeia archaeon]|nr:hypothetical protein [Candidatus Nanoarchaeia archaeon]